MSKLTFVLFFLCFFNILLIVGLTKTVKRNRLIESYLNDKTAQKDQLQTEIYSLQQQYLESQSDRFIEAEIRNNLNLVKPGETLVIIDDSILSATDSATAQNQLPTEPLLAWITLLRLEKLYSFVKIILSGWGVSIP